MPLASVLDFVTAWSWPAVWFWALCLIALVWARRHLQLNQAHREPILSAADAAGDAPLPTLTVLVAAKDEEPNIALCIEGLLKQDYPSLQIVAANDRSDDRTGEILDQIAARDPRLTVVHVRELPPGWCGKNHAMHQAVQHATGEYFCFTDADCRFHDRSLLKAAVRFAQRDKTDLLSVLPRLEAYTFWERAVQPPAGAILVYWFPPSKVNSDRSPVAYANGAFMLMPRAAYAKIGGHEAACDRLNEDMHFAAETKRAGLRLRVIRGGLMYSVRMYAGLRQIWNGWTRIFYCCFNTLPKLIVSAIFLSVFSLGPLISLIASAFAGPYAGGIALAAGAAFLVQQSVLWRFYKISHTPSAWALSYPAGALLCLLITLNAIARHAGAKTTWRGTTYTGGRLGTNRALATPPARPT